MTTWNDTDLTRIETAIAQGVTTVQFEDRSVTYRSMKELLAARAAIAAELASSTAPRQVRFGTDKGFGPCGD